MWPWVRCTIPECGKRETRPSAVYLEDPGINWMACYSYLESQPLVEGHSTSLQPPLPPLVVLPLITPIPCCPPTTDIYRSFLLTTGCSSPSRACGSFSFFRMEKMELQYICVGILKGATVAIVLGGFDSSKTVWKFLVLHRIPAWTA